MYLTKIHIYMLSWRKKREIMPLIPWLSKPSSKDKERTRKLEREQDSITPNTFCKKIKDNTQLRNLNCKWRWIPQNQQSSVDCSKDHIIEICNIIFCILERKKAKGNKSMLNKAMNCQTDRHQGRGGKEQSAVQAVICKKKPFQWRWKILATHNRGNSL